MKPWREVVVPHPDVLEGTFQQAEFAADISAVRAGKATREYQDAAAFFERTFITEGMGLLLTSVANRLNGNGGDPVIQLQTAFGGGKTHTMLAVYHLASRACSLQELAGLPDLLDRAKLMDVPRARIAVLDGSDMSPGQPWKRGRQTVRTLWGELAWQLGGEEAYSEVATADENGTSPGKEQLRKLLETHSPCVVLIDELVAYVRQFEEGKSFSGGTYASNLSFAQSLTEAVKLVPNAVLLASLPESELEAGGPLGERALAALEKTFARVQALWKPVATEEAFEIVRRRLFEPVSDPGARDAVCRAFVTAYAAEGAKLPSDVHESRYLDRLCKAYPIHPEVFDRLFEDWTTLEGFQRTRGVLKLMAKAIYRLWKDQNSDLMILPGSLPLYDGSVRNELVYYLSAGWDAVLEKDIDGERAETSELETKEPRFGALNAARRVARTIFLGSAPSSGAVQRTTRGIDRGRVLLGCLQPGQPSATFSDALNRLSDRLHYLNSSSEKTLESTRFWFDTRANLRREMEDRKSRIDEKTEVLPKLRDVLERLCANVYDGRHVFASHADIPDDAALRIVVLPLGKAFAKDGAKDAEGAILEYLRSHGNGPRHRGNRLLFLAADLPSRTRLRDAARTALAWKSIVDDVKEEKLVVDRLQENQAKKEWEAAEKVLPAVARDCYRWLLCPVLNSPTDREPIIEAFPLPTAGEGFSVALERVCDENELIIGVWSPIHLRSKLQELYWKADRPAVGALQFWEDSLKYLYLPRLRNKFVLETAIHKGAGSAEFFGTALGTAGDRFEGFHLGDGDVRLDDTLLLIEPSVAAAYQAKLAAEAAAATTAAGTSAASELEATASAVAVGGSALAPSYGQTGATTATPVGAKLRKFYGSVEIPAATAKMRLIQVAEEIIQQLARDPDAKLRITVEIDAEFPSGVPDQVKRAVSENVSQLGFATKGWE